MSVTNYADTTLIVDSAITTVAGAGSVIAELSRHSTNITFCAVKAPAGATYNLAMYDKDDFLLYATAGLVGNSAIVVGRLCKQAVLVEISGSTVNGLFSLRFYIET